MQNELTHKLNSLLANGTVLYQKVRYFHWTVTGDQFFDLHTLFEEHYTKWNETNDAVAERILYLHAEPIGTLAGFVSGSSIKEVSGSISAKGMVEAMVADYGGYREQLLSAIKSAESAHDRGTANLLDSILDDLEQKMWMLRAYVK